VDVGLAIVVLREWLADVLHNVNQFGGGDLPVLVVIEDGSEEERGAQGGSRTPSDTGTSTRGRSRLHSTVGPFSFSCERAIIDDRCTCRPDCFGGITQTYKNNDRWRGIDRNARRETRRLAAR
jgi:hypothetical protein